MPKRKKPDSAFGRKNLSIIVRATLVGPLFTSAFNFFLLNAAPKYWEGQEDVEYRRWRDKIHALISRLVPLSETLTYAVVDMLRARVPESGEKVSHRPHLQVSFLFLILLKMLTWSFFIGKGYHFQCDIEVSQPELC